MGNKNSMEHPPVKSILDIAAGTSYPPEAFAFVRDGLHLAAESVHGPEAGIINPALAGKRHVSGQDLCQAMRNLAIERWGMLAKAVLADWNIHCTLDFGKIVYAMIENQLMQRTEDDSLEDFRDVFDFDQAFDQANSLRIKL